MDERKLEAIDHGLAAVAVRVEAMERVLHILAAAVISQESDPDDVLDRIANTSGPQFVTVDGERVALTPEHKAATVAALQTMVEQIRTRVHGALRDRQG